VNGAVDAVLDIEASDQLPVDVAVAEPEVRWRRSAAERRELTRAFLGRLRRGGFRDTLRWAQHTDRRGEYEERYRHWCLRHTPDAAILDAMRQESARWSTRPRFSVLTPVYNTDPLWLAACIDSVRAQAYTNWELILSDDGSTREETRALLRTVESDPRIQVVWNDHNQGIAGATQAALSRASGDFIAMLDHDDVLLPHAIYRVAEHLRRDPDSDLIYSDEDKLELDGRRSDPYFKPDWSPDLFLSSMYVPHFLVLRRAVVEQVGGFRAGYDGAQDYDLVLRFTEHTSKIHHLSDVLYHWRKIPQSASSAGSAKPWAHLAGRRALQDAADRRALHATVEDAGSPGLYRMRYALRAHPLVSIIIVAEEESRDATRELLDEIARSSYLRREVAIVAAATEGGHGDQDPLPVIEIQHQGHVAEQLNAGARASSGEYLLFLRPHMRPQHADWIESLLEHAQRPGVGAVGAKLFSTDGRLRHIGLVRGRGGRAFRPFDGYPGTWAGYFSNANCVRNCVAVSRSAMMINRVTFVEVGGWREPSRGDDLEIDLGVRLLAAGFRVVFTPYARLTELRAESTTATPRATNGPEDSVDPYYNPQFVSDSADYLVRAD